MAVPWDSIQRGPYGSRQALDPPPSLATATPKQSFSPSSSPRAKETQTSMAPAFLSSLARVQSQAQAYLLSAMSQERGKRWFEAIEYYRKLLSCLSTKRFPKEYVPGPECVQLMFETYYHMGVAFQKLDSHDYALEEFTNAIQTTNIPKSACQVGCISSSFYQTPVFARRAYAYVKCDKIKEAISDATRTVHSDPSNPDVYCIRALVWSSAKEKRRALVDLNISFKLQSSHICTLILRGAILNSLGGVASARNKDHDKAYDLSRDSQNFFDVEDFYSPKMPTFYDKFLWSINAFHTITSVNLFNGATWMTKSTYTNRVLGEPNTSGSFKCGSLASYSDNSALLRRKMYSRECVEAATGVHVKKKSSSSVEQQTVKKKSSSSVARQTGKKSSSASGSHGSGSKDF